MQTLEIDFSRPWVPQTVRAMQGDAYSRFVAFDLYDGGSPYEVPGGAAYTVGYQLRGGFEGAYDTITEPGGGSHAAVMASGNRITVELGEVLTVDSNTGFITVLIQSADGKKLHTWAVPLEVGPSSGAAASDPSIAALGELLTASVKKVQDSTAAAEQAAKEAKESADRAAASEPAGAAERAEKAAQQAQEAQAAAESAKAAAESSKTAAASSASIAQTQAETAGAAKTAAESSAAAAAQSAQQAEAALAGLDIEAIKAALIPPGTVQYFATATPPDGWLACNGAAVSRSAYAALFNAIGTTYGTGDNSTTFTLPDLRDRVAWGGTSVGTVKAAGAPAITGTMWPVMIYDATGAGGSVYPETLPSGAFTLSGEFNSDHSLANEGSRIGKSTEVNFRAPAPYGDSNTIQPPALILLPCIKF